MFSGIANLLNETLAFSIHLAGAAFLQDLGEIANRAQRRAQIMRDRIAEIFRFFIEDLQLDRPILQSLFEFCVEQADSGFGLLPLGDVADVALDYLLSPTVYTLLTNSTSTRRPSLARAAGRHSGRTRGSAMPGEEIGATLSLKDPTLRWFLPSKSPCAYPSSLTR